ATRVGLGLGDDAIEPPPRLLASPREGLELRIGGRDVGAPRRELGARVVESGLRARELVLRISDRGLARSDLGGLAGRIRRDHLELGTARLELCRTALAL